MAAITILYAFIYLLHLANEKGSEIEGMEGQEDFIESSDSTMDESPHGELISALNELYTLLVSLAAVPDDILLRLPSPDTGVYAPGAINTTAAIAAGYDADTVALMCALPYLDLDTHDYSVELLPSTFPVSYLAPDLDEGTFEWLREMLNDEAMPATALRLTWSEGGHSYVFIYDTVTKLVTPWLPMENPDEVNDYFYVPAASPRAVLNPLIKDYRSLNYLRGPYYMDFNHELFSESGGKPPKGWRGRDVRRWQASYDVWAAMRRLKDMYLECGWDVDTVEQTHFRRDEFLARRQIFWEDVVEPLLQIEGSVK